MGAILRSSKFLRYITGIARNVAIPATEVDCVFRQGHSITKTLRKNLATQSAAPKFQSNFNLDRSLKQLDEDVRKFGRISRKELEEVLAELRVSESASNTQSLLIIRCCGNLVPEETPCCRTQLVQEIWKTLEKIGVPMDVSHYNALLRVYLENEHPFSPTEFLSNMDNKGVEPNHVTYQRLIARFCQDGNIEGATRILEFMREKQLPVTEGVFNALITGHSQAADMESAAGILTVMQHAGLEPSGETYTTLLRAYAKRGNMEAISNVLEQCDKKDILLLDKDYMDIIYTLAVNNHDSCIDMLIGRLRQMAGYNQDAVNLILRLVNSGVEDVALKILHTMPLPSKLNDQTPAVGSFFIRQLVKAKRPVEKIVSLCLELERKEMNPRALLIAMEASMLLGNMEQGIALLLAMKQEGHPIRAHYFWPFLVVQGKKGDMQGLLKILTIMVTEFHLLVGGETLRDYIVPYFMVSDTDSNCTEVISQLNSSGVSVASAASAIVYNLLLQGRLAEAAKVASQYRAHYSFTMLRRPLISAYQRKNDTESFLQLVYHICEGTNRIKDVGIYGSAEEENIMVSDCSEIIGQLLMDVVVHLQSDISERLQPILKGLLAYGLGISSSATERLQAKLEGKLTNEISELLAKLSRSDLIPLPLNKPLVQVQPTLNEHQLKIMIAAQKTKGESVNGPMRRLLTLYCRNRDLERAEHVYKELEANGFLTSGMMAQMIELYTYHNNLEKALSLLDQLKTKEAGTFLDDTKTIKVATLLVQNGRVQDALNLLQEKPCDRKGEERSAAYISLCWRILNNLANQGDVTSVEQMFDTLVDYQYVQVNNLLLNPLVKVHLVKDDIASAISKFEYCCTKYRSTPLKTDLTCRLIQAEDPVLLQKLTDLSTEVHGEVNSLYDLAFAFVECGRIRQARKILETPGLRSRPQRFSVACERFRNVGLLTALEGLLEVTRDLSHIDRSDIYHHLLLSYSKVKDVDKALGLWTKMQEEDVQPSDEFFINLAKLLEENGKQVPFAVPNVVKIGETSETLISMSEVQQFQQAIKEDNCDKALEIKHSLENKGTYPSAFDLSLLINSLMKCDRMDEAIDIVRNMLRNGNYPIPRTFRSVFQNLATSGQVDTLTEMGKLMDLEKKKMVSYNNILCIANVTAGQALSYLDSLEKEIDSVNDQDVKDTYIAKLEDKFPRGGVLVMLRKHPELLSQYEKIAHKYISHGILAPINMLWAHQMMQGEEAAADKLWDEFLCKQPRIMFQNVLHNARKQNDVKVAQKVVNLLKTSMVSEKARGIAHSCLIHVLVNRGQVDEALATLDAAVKDVCLDNMSQKELQRLQREAVNRGKPFPFSIPTKAAKDQSSSSSSDEEDKPDKY